LLVLFSIVYSDPFWIILGKHKKLFLFRFNKNYNIYHKFLQFSIEYITRDFTPFLEFFRDNSPLIAVKETCASLAILSQSRSARFLMEIIINKSVCYSNRIEQGSLKLPYFFF